MNVILRGILEILSKNNLDALYMSNTNEHLSEFIGESDMRIKQISGFSGSNAKLVITEEETAMFTDGRYFLQAEYELNESIHLKKGDDLQMIMNFITEKITGGRLGIDLRYLSYEEYLKLKDRLSNEKVELVPIEFEIFKDVLKSLPGKKMNQILDIETFNFSDYITFKKDKELNNIFNRLYEDNFEYEYDELIENNLIPGISFENKIKIVKRGLKMNEGYLLSTLDAVAWLLNLRGTEIPENTVFYAFVYITKRNIMIFTDHKIPRDLKIEPYKNVYNFLKDVKETKIYTQSKVNAKIAQSIGDKRISQNNQFDKLKSIKNKNEIAGFFQAAILDGISLIKLFVWLDKVKMPITEIEVSQKLLEIKNNLNITQNHNNFTTNNDVSHVFSDANPLNTHKMKGDNPDGLNKIQDANPLNTHKMKGDNPDGLNKIQDVNPLNTHKMKGDNPDGLNKIQDVNPLNTHKMKGDNPDGLNKIQDANPLNTHKMKGDNLEVEVSIDFPTISSLTDNFNKTGSQNDIKRMTVGQNGYFFPSFANVVAYAENGAVVHHFASNQKMERDNLMLIDSGSQYLFGTTDITRTIALDKPTNEQIHDYTLVLKGTILAKRFRGSSDNEEFHSMIENLPKYYLLQENKNYNHSTSHGIGSGLFVHESPPFSTYNLVEPHQIFSIEPGFYKENEYGIRIEDAVISLQKSNMFLQNMTFLPYQKRLIDKKMLTNEEITYLNEYNQDVFLILKRYLNEEEMRWLAEETSFL
ncbi:Xaa-Pro aminopeptidase [Pseudoloma neurophilia]|uniref:Xaa-Pro aminopeptidase n=1 Tax=Pseudoloma neurophilia TaxID=146866 RepID=A0A0R0LYG6_9MICR|nr:Xaa-Pro aminopeptidase [Pseudoloma neurophilia]